MTFFYFLTNRGSDETLTEEVFDKLAASTKQTLASQFHIEKDNIKMDLDAFSVIITAKRKTQQSQNSMRNFLLHFCGRASGRCGFPKYATGSKKKDDILGCRGNACQHLPSVLRGKEMLIIDRPV